MVSTRNTSFEELQKMFSDMLIAEKENDWRKVNAIMVDMQDWFMGSPSRMTDLQVAYLKDPETFKEMWERCLSGPVNEWEAFLFHMFPEKGELVVANSDIDKLMKERDKLTELANKQEAIIESFEEDLSENIKRHNQLNEQIYYLNIDITEKDRELRRLNDEMLRLKSKLFDLIEENEKLKS
jgi:hypothetical protein